MDWYDEWAMSNEQWAMSNLYLMMRQTHIKHKTVKEKLHIWMTMIQQYQHLHGRSQDIIYRRATTTPRAVTTHWTFTWCMTVIILAARIHSRRYKKREERRGATQWRWTLNKSVSHWQPTINYSTSSHRSAALCYFTSHAVSPKHRCMPESFPRH